MGLVHVRRALLGSSVLLAITLGASPALAAAHKHASAEKPAGLVELNSATEAELVALPGIGPATAKKIIAGRPYAAVSDLSKAGVSAATIAKVTPLVTVSAAVSSAPASAQSAPAARKKAATAAPAGPVELNSATEAELVALPAVGPATAKKIMAGRPYATVADLSKAGVSAATIAKITPLVTVSAPPPVAAAPARPIVPAPAFAPPPPPPPPQAAPAAPVAPVAQQPVPAASSSMGHAPAAQPPVAGMVWVNLSSKVFHRAGDEWYGKTKRGEFMTEADALKAGYREAKMPGAKKQ